MIGSTVACIAMICCCTLLVQTDDGQSVKNAALTLLRLKITNFTSEEAKTKS